MPVLALIAATLFLGVAERPRVLVLTDIGSLTAGVGEPDDGQSLIRFLLYANDFDVEGLVASSNMGHGQRTRPDLIMKVIDAYEQVHAGLIRHDARYPTAAFLRERVKAGQPTAGPKTPVADSVGPGKSTEASRWIVQAADRDDARPLWILVWGGSADLAQALDDVRREREPARAAALRAKLRVHAIGDQDSTGPWIKEQFPDLFVVTQQRAYRGMYRGGDVSLAGSDWVKTNLRGRGALGNLYPDYRGGDIFPKLGPVRGVKEGDTPSFLALIPNGLTDLDRPDLGSWGGRFREVAPRRWIDVPDGTPPGVGDPDPRMASVYRWREAFQADFSARLNWCVQPTNRANHPPVASIRGERTRSASPGEWVELDASASSDPDGDPLAFAWSVYPADGMVPPTIEGEATPRARFRTPDRFEEIPLLLTVKDGGTPALTRYARVLIRAKPR